jgi:hypothetical protein
MAYVCKQFWPASAADMLAQIEAQLVNMGWILHDTVSATVKVYKSTGELGTFLTGYLWLSLAGNALTCLPYAWWNAATDSGNTQGTSELIVTYSAGHWYVIAGDKDLVMVRYVNNTCALMGFFPKRFHNTPYAEITAPCLAGNGIVLSVTDTTGFVMNQTYWIIGLAGEGRWRANVIGKGVGTLTVDNLGSALAAGAKIGANVMPFGCTHASISTITFYGVWDRVTTGTGAVGDPYTIISIPNLVTMFDPDLALGYAGAPYNTPGLYALTPLVLRAFSSGTIFYDAVSDTNFLANPNGAAETTFGVTADGAPIDTGTADVTSGNFTLVCLGKVWGANVHAGKVVVIASGTGAGQTRVIASNTADTLTVNTQWETNPNGTSIFFIFDEVYRVPTANSTICYKERI